VSGRPREIVDLTRLVLDCREIGPASATTIFQRPGVGTLVRGIKMPLVGDAHLSP
jgi:hypothetical protein